MKLSIEDIERTARNLIDGNVPVIMRAARMELQRVHELEGALRSARGRLAEVCRQTYDGLVVEWGRDEVAAAFFKK